VRDRSMAPGRARFLKPWNQAARPCYKLTMSALSPIESEFATTEDAEAYESWFRGKVRASLKDRRPSLPHDDVMVEIDAIIGEAEQQERR
jgi:hypothetical protein